VVFVLNIGRMIDIFNNLKPMEVGLARDSGGTFSTNVGCESAIAGKPAPTGAASRQL
jgi:hypothetical protein